MARGPGVLSFGYGRLILIESDGTTRAISPLGLGFDYGFHHDQGSSYWQVFVSAPQSIVDSKKEYEFQRWEFSGVVPEGLDANSPATESNRYDEPGGDINVWVYYKAKSEDRGTVVVEPVSNPRAGGTAVSTPGSYTGEVGTSGTFTLTATAKAGYVFKKWSDGGKRVHTITETVLSTGTRYVHPIAYFRKTTGLILRSASAGIILRGGTGSILRDE